MFWYIRVILDKSNKIGGCYDNHLAELLDDDCDGNVRGTAGCCVDQKSKKE